MPASWGAASGKFRLGTKRAYDLYPSLLSKRLKDKARKEWSRAHRETLAALEKQLVDWDLSLIHI